MYYKNDSLCQKYAIHHKETLWRHRIQYKAWSPQLYLSPCYITRLEHRNNVSIGRRETIYLYFIYFIYSFPSLFLVLPVQDLFGPKIISKHCSAVKKLETPHLWRLQIELKLLSRQAKAWRTVFDSYFIWRPWMWTESVHGLRMKVSIESPVPHLTLRECVRKMCLSLHFLLM